MSIMDFFRNNTDSAGKSDNSNGEVGKENLSDSNKTTNENGKMPGTDQTPENPLDSYAKMFENAAKNSDIQAPIFKIDPKVVSDVSSKMDFTSDIPEEVMQKAMSGDAKAFLSVIQATSQNAYKAAIQHGTSLTDTFLTQRTEYDQSQINKGVKDQLTNQAMSDAPNFSHPVVKQELNRVASQFAKANPDASPQEIAKSAQKYISDLANALNPKSESNAPANKGEFDWSKYING